jgi:hypothetical protein
MNRYEFRRRDGSRGYVFAETVADAWKAADDARERRSRASEILSVVRVAKRPRQAADRKGER